MRAGSLAAVLILTLQAGVCGVRGFGIGEGLARAQDVAAPRAEASHCAAHEPPPPPGSSEPRGGGEPGCRDHCRLYAQAITVYPPAPAPAGGALVIALAAQLPALPAGLGGASLAALREPPPTRPLPLLHSALRL